MAARGLVSTGPLRSQSRLGSGSLEGSVAGWECQLKARAVQGQIGVVEGVFLQALTPALSQVVAFRGARLGLGRGCFFGAA